MPRAIGSRPSLLEAMDCLQVSLDGFADALASWRLEDVAAAGDAVATALELLPEGFAQTAEIENWGFPRALRRVEGSLARCRRLGSSLDELAGGGLGVTSEHIEYGRSGSTVASRPSMMLRKEV